MQYLYLSFLVWIAATFSLTAAKPLTLSDSQHLNARIPVHAPEDINVQVADTDPFPLPQKATIFFFHIIQLDIYHRTLERGGDAVLTEATWERHYNGLILRVRPILSTGTTWADVLFGLQKILARMVDPSEREQFQVSKWGVGRRQHGAPFESTETVAYVDLYRPMSESSLEIPASTVNASFNTSGSLSAPFVIPETHISLLVGSRGADLLRSPVVQCLDNLIADTWRSVAINGRSTTIRSINFESPQPEGKFWGILRPRKNGAVSLFTETDLVETIIGIVYYMVQHGFYTTTFTTVRWDARGKRTVVGAMEFGVGPRPRFGLTGSSNASLVEVN